MVEGWGIERCRAGGGRGKREDGKSRKGIWTSSAAVGEGMIGRPFFGGEGVVVRRGICSYYSALVQLEKV